MPASGGSAGKLWFRGVLVVVFVAFICESPAAQDSSSETSDLNDITLRAEAAQREGRLEDAEALYKRSLERNPRWADGWWHLGLLLLDQRRYHEAETVIESYMGLQSGSGPAYALRGLCRYHTGRFETSSEDFQRAQTLGLGEDKTLSRAVRYYTSLIMIRKSLFGSALLTLVPFANDHDEGEDVLLAFGLAMLRVQVAPEELNPAKKDLVLRAGRAAFLASEHRFPEASHEYSRLLAAYPTAPNVHYDYGVYLYLGKDLEKALNAFKEELALYPDNVAADIYAGLICLKIGRFAEGLAFAHEAVALDPNSYVAQYELGQLLLKTDQPSVGIQHLETAEGLAANNEEVHYALLIAYARVGRKADAEREHAIFQRIKKSETFNNKGLGFAHSPELDDMSSTN
jgi:tetratricopeptide (TPR) repeat protein